SSKPGREIPPVRRVAAQRQPPIDRQVDRRSDDRRVAWRSPDIRATSIANTRRTERASEQLDFRSPASARLRDRPGLRRRLRRPRGRGPEPSFAQSRPPPASADPPLGYCTPDSLQEPEPDELSSELVGRTKMDAVDPEF